MFNFRLGYIPSSKWMIFIALGFLAFVMIAKNFEGKKCKTVCLKKGYPEFRYSKQGRHGYPPETCFCLTEDEKQFKHAVIPKGLKIDLNKEQ